MNQGRIFALVALLSFALLPAQALAEEEAENQPVLEARLVNLKGKCVFTLEGTAPKYPDGTLLHVTLFLNRGKGLGNLEASSFMVRLEKERFQARRVYNNQQFACLNYWVRVEMLLTAQRKALADWIRREHALPRDARVGISRQDLTIGTPEAQKAFRLQTIHELRDRIHTVQGIARETLAYLGTGQVSPPKELLEAANRFVLDWRAYRSQYVAWHETYVMGGVKGANTEILRGLQTQGKRRRVKKSRRTLTKAAQILENVLADLESRLPRPKEEETEKGEGASSRPASQPASKPVSRPTEE